MINIEQLKQDLETLIAGLDDESTAEDLLTLVASIDSLTADRIVSIATVNQLPDLFETEFPSGSVFFVEEIDVLVVSVEFKWLGLDGRLLRYDGPPDADAMSWGFNNNGHLGDGTISDRSSPVTVIGGITNWSQVSAGGSHSLGVTNVGIAYAWGNNGFGRLGDGTIITDRLSPVNVIGDITNWSQVSAGGFHSLGVTDDGIAYAWGRNLSGRLGDGTITDRSSPITVVGGITNWSQLSAGAVHSLGVTDDGIAYAWGSNGSGRLGDGTRIDRSSPVTVIGGITNWSQVSAGGFHSLGLTDDGIAYAWSSGFSGILGNGSTIARSSPVTVVGGITNWSQLSAGDLHSLGVTDDGIAYAWGRNINGQLGDGTLLSKNSPITVVGGITNWSQVSGGVAHSLGLTDDGIAYAWGNNNQGRLGDETTIEKSSPVTVIGGITNWSQLSAGYDHSLGLKAADE